MRSFPVIFAFCAWLRTGLGDKSNHIPSFHVPQLYYFVGFTTLMGWPALVSAQGGVQALARGIWQRMFGSRRYTSRECGIGMSGPVTDPTLETSPLLA